MLIDQEDYKVFSLRLTQKKNGVAKHAHWSVICGRLLVNIHDMLVVVLRKP